MRRFIRLLALALVLCLVPVGAFAESQLPTGQRVYKQIPFRANPLYEGLVSEAELLASAEAGTICRTQPTFLTGAAVYVSPEEAVLQLREQLKARAQTIDLYVESEYSDYEALIDTIMAYAMVHTGVPNEGDYLLWDYGGWYGEVYMEPSDGTTYAYHFVMHMSYYTTAQQEQELDAAIDALLASLALEGKSDYEKLCAVYDYMCSNITYDYEHLNDPSYLVQYTAYGALIHKTAVCQGFSGLLYRLLLELGIDTRIITGETEEGAHAWNIVRLGDVYYNLDVTWDATMGARVYFLRNSEGFEDHYRYLEYCSAEFHNAYPMSETDYADGVEGVPEHTIVRGICGEDAYWTIDRDGVLTISGSGAMEPHPYNEPVLWDFWKDAFDTLVIEEGITNVGQYAFSGLSNLVEISLPDSIKIVGHAAFQYCSGLREVRIPDGVTTIGGKAFYQCTALETLDLGNTVGFIYAEAFYGCSSLKELTLPDSVDNIEHSAFGGCNLLKEVTVPASVRVGAGFEGCGGLETAHIHSYNVYGAFENCVNLRNVTLYDTVAILNAQSFENCQSLETITIPASVYQVATRCFADCTSLKEVVFLGDAPEFSVEVFQNVTATVYYPADNPTWTEAVMQQYDGNITWLPDTMRTPAAGLLGDVNGDDIIDSYDATLILRYDVGVIDGTDLMSENMDVSGDGVIDSYDATLVLRYDVGMIPAFPAEG